MPRILVIRGGALGDFILTLPAIKLLRENFPHAHLEILGYKHIIALAEGRYYADATRSIEYAALARFFIPHAALAPDLIEYFAGFQQIVSYLFDPDQLFENNLRRCGVKNFLHASPKLDDTAHAAQQLARPLERLALFLDEPAAVLHPNAADQRFATDFLQSFNGSSLIALHPGSGSAKKNWPLENWRELGDWLLAHGHVLLVVGGEAEQAALRTLRHSWPAASAHFAQDLPLPPLAALLARATLFLGHDSGLSHLAAAAGARALLLFGPTDPEVWAPANRHVRVLRAPEGELAKLSPTLVKNKVNEMLAHFPRE